MRSRSRDPLDGTDTWDTPREILSTAPPYWLRPPPRPALLIRPPERPTARDRQTLDLFTGDADVLKVVR